MTSTSHKESGDGQKMSLLFALNKAAAQIQRSARSETDVYRAFHAQIVKLGLSGSVNILSEDGQSLRLVIAAIPWEQVARLEELEGTSYQSLLDADVTSYQFNIPVASVNLYQQVLDTGRSYFEPDNSEYISQIIPDEFRFLVKAVVATFGGQPSICAPLVIEGKIQGLMTVNGISLSAEDIPTVEAFANHTAVALENARLFAVMQAREAEQKRVDEALRESEQKYREMIRQSTDGIFLVNEQGMIIEWNAGMERITGIDPSQALDHYVWDIQLQLHPQPESARKIRRSVISQARSVLKTGYTPMMDKPHEYDIMRPDGATRHIQVVLYSLKTDIGYRICSIVRDITERKELEIDRSHRAEELAVLQSLSLDLTSVHDLPVLLTSIVERAVQLLGARGGGLYLCTPELDQVRLYVEIRGAPDELIGMALKYGEGAAGLVASTGKPLIIDDYRVWPGRSPIFESAQPYTAVLSVPMIWQGQVTGVLQVLDNLEVRQFNDADTELLMLFANHAAVALETTRLLEAERRQRREAETLVKASSALTSTLELEQLLDTILTYLEKVVPYDSASVFLLKGDQLNIVAGRGFLNGNSAIGAVYPVQQDGLFTQIQSSAHSLILHDAQQDLRFHGYGNVSHVHGWLGVPLMVRSQVIGCLTLDSQQPGIYTAAHIPLAEAFANQAAAAIEHARLFEVERLARRRADAIREAAAVVSSSLSLNQVLDAVLEQLARVLFFDSGNIMFIEGDRAVIKVWRGYSQEDVDQLLESISFDLSPDKAVGMVVSTGESMSMANVKDDPRWQITELGESIQSWLGVPLIIRGQVIGLFNLDRTSADGFSEDEVALAQTFAAHAVAAIENARLFEQAAMERRYLSLLYDVGRSLASSVDFNEILNRAVSLTCMALGGLVGQAFLLIPETDQLRLCALYGKDHIDLQSVNEQMDIRLGIGLAGCVAQNRQAVYVIDVTEDERWKHVDSLDRDVHSAITAPILYGDRVFGVISVLHHERDAFSEDHLDLLQAICREVALSLSNADRYQQVNRRLSETTLIQNLAQIFTQRLDLRVLLDEVVEQLYQRFHYPLVEIFLLSGNKLTLQAFRGQSPKVLDQKISQGIVGRVARTGEVNFVPDVSLDPEYYCCSSDTVAELAVPICRDEKVIGVINIESHLHDQLTEHDRDLLQMLAGQISIALENAVLYERVRSHAEELERTVEQRTGELTSVYELSQKIGYTLSYDDLMRLVLTSLRNAVGCEITAGCLVINGYRLFLIESERNISTRAVEQIRSVCIDHMDNPRDGALGIDTAPVEVICAQEFQSFYPEIEQVDSTFATLILVGRKVVGVLIAGSEKDRVFARSQMRLLETFAHQTATAIERITAILAAEQKRLEGLVEHLPVGVLLLDSDYRLLVSNPLGRQVLDGLEVGIKDGFLTSLAGKSMDGLIQRYREPLPFEFVQEGPPRRFFEAQVRPMGQDTRQWVVTLREVTQERENQARIQMQERLATVGQLAAGIAHDFNNIMAAILVYADLLMSDPGLPTSSRDRLAIIEQQVQRAASLIRQILDFSRRAVMEQSALDLLPFMKELERMLGRVMPETIRLELAYTPGSYTVKADPTRLQQVFINLAVNARDAMPQDGVLHFSLERYRLLAGENPPVPDQPVGEWIKITIKDTGVGISPEMLPHIFEPFYTTKPVGQGTGLGLAQVYGIIKQHDGFIDVHSQPGKGTEFTIYLPAILEPKIDRKQTEPLTSLDGAGKAVLVVEDDQATLAALRALLEAKNYDVITASNGSEALRQFERSGDMISLIVSDVVMPQMDGLALYKALQDLAPEMKILFITGHPLEGENQALLERGDVHWLQKPFSAREFTRVIQNLLEV